MVGIPPEGELVNCRDFWVLSGLIIFNNLIWPTAVATEQLYTILFENLHPQSEVFRMSAMVPPIILLTAMITESQARKREPDRIDQ